MIPPPAEAGDQTPLGVARVVSRGFHKLQHALHKFNIDAQALACADLGASVGGFSQCLLACGAAKVYAVDTARGILDYAVRRDPRVVAIERANALHAQPPERVDLVVIDLGWTPQRLALPAAAKWLDNGGRIISLIKPHYEAGQHLTSERDAERITHETIGAMGHQGFVCHALAQSPIAGSRRKGKAAAAGTGNTEWLALFTPTHPQSPETTNT